MPFPFSKQVSNGLFTRGKPSNARVVLLLLFAIDIMALGKDLMNSNLWRCSLVALSLVMILTSVFGQTKQQRRTLVVNGQSGEAAVVQVDGRLYVDLGTLVSIANGSVAFQGNRIVVTVPSSANEPLARQSDHAADSGFSREFMRAGIEEIALMREWASPLAYAIQNGYPVTEQWVAGYREQAANGLRLAAVAVTTEADRSAIQLLTNEFEAVKEWSNKLVEARKSMDTAKYAMSASALQNDPLSQKIVTCGRFLGPMLASGQFQDDPSCH